MENPRLKYYFVLLRILVFPCLRDYVTNKSISFLPEYSINYNDMRCLNLTSSHICVTRHAQFDEHTFPVSGSIATSNPKALDVFTFHEPISRSKPDLPGSTPEYL
ncbi:hypothetical protein OSB04_016140 [Centaurea solstitialis]|uniref:Uncharacterized protein n=1 Tax=Centaurea solstitialis TaxID=347529 RepID=A0AA38WH59_9ASTR|nr:hypothetical protein OSB04_016140 [Centaurea solstitialis]